MHSKTGILTGGGALTATAIVASFKLKLALHNYIVAKSKKKFWAIHTTNAGQMEDFFEFCVTKGAWVATSHAATYFFLNFFIYPV